MRIQDLKSWPPAPFKSAHRADDGCPTDNLAHLRLLSACYISGRTPNHGGDLVLVVEDLKSGETCTSRMRVDDPELGRRLEMVLGQCRGVSLAQAGLVDLTKPILS